VNTFLFAWNPKKWKWENLSEAAIEANQTGKYIDNWSCGNIKQIKKGDRAFLIKLGKHPKGIIGSGFVVSDIYKEKHWDKERAMKNIKVNKVDIEFDVLSEIPIINDDELKVEMFKGQIWYTQMSGISIKESIAKELEKIWQIKTNTKYFIKIEEISKLYSEGKRILINTYVYERNTQAREICLKKHGYNCFVCGFSFANVFGDLGKGFIHVHHKKPVSEIDKEYQVNAENDLIPICPNCHAMIHRNVPAYDIDELKNIIRNKSITFS
jgi:5-methylcytosine-specific restriction protein A